MKTYDANKLAQKPLRRCQSLHQCCICTGDILYRELYRDGGYGNRAHEVCVVRALVLIGGEK